MPRKLKPKLLPQPLILSRSLQITDSHCGPAVIQMLFANLGIEVSQEAIAEAGGANETIEEHGMRIDQLALAVKRLSPSVEFWYKDKSKLNELIKLVTVHQYPVGVEWQGLFDSPEEIEEDDDDEDEETDYGHYSVVTFVDRKSRQLIIVDPYKDFVDQDRIFTFDVFKRRWWDTNEVTDPLTGVARYVVDDRIMFILTPAEVMFPLSLGMKKYMLPDALV